MSLRFHEIAESNHRILNPFTEEQLMLLGDICRLQAGQRQLDLCCGKGEMLCRWAAHYGIQGVGVDISQVFLAAARRRAVELQVEANLTFIEADASQYPVPRGEFDLVSCIGATWIGSGLVGTLKLMRPGLKNRDSLLLVGEPFWIDEPPDEAYEWITEGDREMFTTLIGTLQRFESAGLELVEMVLADHHGWDRYEAMHWLAVSDWLRAHPDDPEAEELRRWNERNQREYLTYGRRYFGWGVFALRQP
jgi:SAM-dependent methyltransferase